jgi:hypothetical protein
MIVTKAARQKFTQFTATFTVKWLIEMLVILLNIICFLWKKVDISETLILIKKINSFFV